MYDDWLSIGVIAVGYVLTLLTSGLVVRAFVRKEMKPDRNIEGESQENAKSRLRVGAIVGKCENFLTITFILQDALTGLALIFAAKSIVRSDQIKKDPGYYLAGTLVNFSYSVLMGFLVKYVSAWLH